LQKEGEFDGWAMYMNGIDENAYNILIIEPEGNKSFGSSRRKWEENIKTEYGLDLSG
jgi:hypothetical protein